MTQLSQAKRDELRMRYLNVDTSNVADVLDGLGCPDQALAAAFTAVSTRAGRVAGWAYTIRGQMTPGTGKGDPDKMRACQGLSPGEVSVWSGDDDGVIVVPQQVVEDVLAQSEKLTQTESRIRAELQNGLTLAQALEKFGHV